MDYTLQSRLDDAEGLAALRGEALRELATLTNQLWCRVDGGRSVSAESLGGVLASLGEHAANLADLAQGYAEALPDDIVCPDIRDDLKRGGWTPMSAAEVVNIVDVEARGIRTGWRRGEHALVLWFTGPYSIAEVYSSVLGWLVDRQEIRTIVRTDPSTPFDPEVMHPRCPFTSPARFDGSLGGVTRLLTAHGWRHEGATTWAHPDLPMKVFLWTAEDGVRIGYWAGYITSMDQLDRVARRNEGNE